MERFFILDGISFYDIENFLNYPPLLELKTAYSNDKEKGILGEHYRNTSHKYDLPDLFKLIEENIEAFKS